jgi:hypothetical protein
MAGTKPAAILVIDMRILSAIIRIAQDISRAA